MNRLLIISSEFPPQPGGIGHQALNLANTLHQAGKSIQILTNSREKNGATERAFDQTLPYPVHRIRRSFFPPRTYWNRCTKLWRILAHHPETTLVASGQFSLWMAAIGKFFFPKIHTLAIIHGSELGAKYGRKYLTFKSLQTFNTIVAVSNFTQNMLLKTWPDAPIQVIQNGVNLTKFNPPTPAQNAPMSRQPSLLTLGNITRRKGQHQVIRALPTLRNTFPNLHFHMIGLPTEQVEISKLAAQMGVSQHISIHGTLTDAEIASFLTHTDLMIMLSENTSDGDVEGFGMALIEANAQGIPAIGAKGCGIEDAILDGVSGRLVDAQNPTAIRDALADILQNYAHYTEGARRWSEQFNWAQKGPQYLALLP